MDKIIKKNQPNIPIMLIYNKVYECKNIKVLNKLLSTFDNNINYKCIISCLTNYKINEPLNILLNQLSR